MQIDAQKPLSLLLSAKRHKTRTHSEPEPLEEGSSVSFVYLLASSVPPPSTASTSDGGPAEVRVRSQCAEGAVEGHVHSYLTALTAPTLLIRVVEGKANTFPFCTALCATLGLALLAFPLSFGHLACSLSFVVVTASGPRRLRRVFLLGI